MIAISDAVLVLISVIVLGVGLYRWQSNIDQATIASTQSVNSTQIRAPAAPAAPASASAEQNAVVSQTEIKMQDAPVTIAAADATVQNDTQTSADASENTDNTSAPDPTPVYGEYIVQSGDTLSQIAEQFGTSISTLQQINDIDGSLIVVGKSLRYPLAANANEQ